MDQVAEPVTTAATRIQEVSCLPGARSERRTQSRLTNAEMSAMATMKPCVMADDITTGGLLPPQAAVLLLLAYAMLP